MLSLLTQQYMPAHALPALAAYLTDKGVMPQWVQVRFHLAQSLRILITTMRYCLQLQRYTAAELQSCPDNWDDNKDRGCYAGFVLLRIVYSRR